MSPSGGRSPNHTTPMTLAATPSPPPQHLHLEDQVVCLPLEVPGSRYDVAFLFIFCLLWEAVYSLFGVFVHVDLQDLNPSKVNFGANRGKTSTCPTTIAVHRAAPSVSSHAHHSKHYTHRRPATVTSNYPVIFGP